MSGQKLLGIPIIIQASESEKNRLEEIPNLEKPAAPVITNKLYIGSLPLDVSEKDLTQLFDRFGPIDYINLHFDSETGRSKGFAFIQYRSTFDARRAVERMNNYEINGTLIKVGPVPEKKTDKKRLDEGDADDLSLNKMARIELMSKLARDDVRTSSTYKYF